MAHSISPCCLLALSRNPLTSDDDSYYYYYFIK